MNVLSNEDAAYLAGFIDGEGCISYEKYKVGGRSYYRPTVIVSNTNLEVLEWICLATGVGKPRTMCKKPRSKEQFIIRWCHNAAIDVLRQTLPFLKIKHGRAKLILSNFDKEKEKGSTRTFRELPGELLASRESLYAEMKELNKRGVN